MRCWAFLVIVVIFLSHLRSCWMVIPRNLYNSALLTMVPCISKGGNGVGFLLKSVTISTVFCVFSSRLSAPHHDTSWLTSSRYLDSSPSEMRPIRVVSSANLRTLTDSLLEVQALM
ncbi:hypothetical protein ANANG_G00226640 [Anguilla anguilla]|uniref:Secreted protein n=1 Tax=Anguilla anguilla TaxID=7936 RepID=A0A9D3LX64_ANGAN|nr:hypothetical protein ANANG_G00226640 [Anguilla anguilla]